MNASLHYSLPGYGLGATSPVVAATGGVLMSLAPVPVVGPFAVVAGAVTELLASIGIGAGCGNTCIQASNYANQAEVLLKQNLATYKALPAPRGLSEQTAALANFDQIWNGLVQACAGISGAAGKNCVGDRQAGACHYKDSNGNCWNWFIGYRDPISSDTSVYNDSAVSASTVAGSTSTSTGGTTTVSLSSGSDLLWIGGAILAGLFLVSKL